MFSGENYKNISNLLSAEFAKRVLKVIKGRWGRVGIAEHMSQNRMKMKENDYGISYSKKAPFQTGKLLSIFIVFWQKPG